MTHSPNAQWSLDFLDGSPSLPEPDRREIKQANTKEARQGTFTDNMKLPIHRWVRYSAGFSADWVQEIIRQNFPDRRPVILDPFAGSGTTLIAAAQVSAHAIGFESHPFVYRMAAAKLQWHRVAAVDFLAAVADLIARAQALQPQVVTGTAAPLLLKCYTPESLASLFALKAAYELLAHKNTPLADLLWLTITAALRACSYVGTAQWQYVLPNKRKATTKAPYAAVLAKAHEIAGDMLAAQSQHHSAAAKIYLQDVRDQSTVEPGSVDLVITSPPYPNNYDYADATRLELTFWGEIERWSDLQDKVRQYIIRSCSQHSAAEKLVLEELLQLPSLKVISAELRVVCEKLGAVRLEKAGKKTYHTMVAAYFADLAATFIQLRRLCRSGANMYFVVGDSAPYGIYVPVDQWLGQLALAAGFKSYRFDKLRDRNTKWKNRKHRVPLHEGCLWIEG